jgi:hypothetical protein
MEALIMKSSLYAALGFALFTSATQTAAAGPQNVSYGVAVNCAAVHRAMADFMQTKSPDMEAQDTIAKHNASAKTWADYAMGLKTVSRDQTLHAVKQKTAAFTELVNETGDDQESADQALGIDISECGLMESAF